MVFLSLDISSNNGENKIHDETGNYEIVQRQVP